MSVIDIVIIIMCFIGGTAILFKKSKEKGKHTCFCGCKNCYLSRGKKACKKG